MDKTVVHSKAEADAHIAIRTILAMGDAYGGPMPELVYAKPQPYGGHKYRMGTRPFKPNKDVRAERKRQTKHKRKFKRA